MHQSSKQVIWTNTQLPEVVDLELRRVVGGAELRYSSHRSASNLVGTPRDPSLDGAEIAFGQPDAEQIMESSSLKWVHLTSAGYTNYDRDDLRVAFRERGIVLTTSSGVYDEPCAQHVFSMILAMCRQLPACWEDQRESREWPAARIRANSTLLRDQKVVIYGYGEIAKRVCELLAPFHLDITGVRRTPQGNESVPVVSLEKADAVLAEADHVLNILPANRDSNNYFSSERLKLIKPTACFYNIGRGTTVDQGALACSLNEGRIAGAYLDVTVPEPLPPNDPLWTAKNCWITPHTAGGFQGEMAALVKHFEENLGRFRRGEPLLNQVIG